MADIEDKFSPDKKTLTEVFKSSGGNIFSRTLGRLFGAGLPPGGEGPMSANTTAKWSRRSKQTDWRVKLTLRKGEDMYNFFFNGGGKTESQSKSNILGPLAEEGGIIFPLTPSVILQHNANYNPLATTHANYPFYAYQNSEPANMTIVAEFPVQNQQDALYWVATLHFLRSATKMFFGGEEGDANRGNPPPICTLNGYGNHVFKNIPCVISTFTCELREGIDYISTSQMGMGGAMNSGADTMNPNEMRTMDQDSALPETWAPTQSLFTIQLQPVYSRDTIKKFNMKDFISGDLQNKDGIGFI